MAQRQLSIPRPQRAVRRMGRADLVVPRQRPRADGVSARRDFGRPGGGAFGHLEGVLASAVQRYRIANA